MSEKSSLKTFNDNEISILVLSDLHSIVDLKFNDDSRLYFEDDMKSEYGDAFIDYAKNLPPIDYVICPGDISNKSCSDGFKAGWKFLHNVKKELGARALYCVPGNHDHKSRTNSDTFSPKHELQFIKPSFPHDCHIQNTHFWAWNWSVIEEENFNLILVNTSAYHGYGENEFDMGRVARETSLQIQETLKEISCKKFNILVCHHHPYPMTHVDNKPDTQSINGGTYLLDCLDNMNIGPWLVLHGHKHYAQIKLGPSSSGSHPVILSAGSFSARLYDEIDKRTSNQFYILKIKLTETEEEDKVVGNFYTHECVTRVWRKSRSKNLPAVGGFGSDLSPKKIVLSILNKIDNNPFIPSEDIQEEIKNIYNLIPDAYEKFLLIMKENNLSIEFEDDNIIQIGKNYDK